ncbi:hypothetical protein [Lactobacillus delbrueckii]|uniref:hypothetical protein n=1 Tax=Lactobacillus delbrueckii TaxID=1584 RepID=UPI0022E8BCDE|nr:hypothetical protein [Lactobacillus delbrueckii]
MDLLKTIFGIDVSSRKSNVCIMVKLNLSERAFGGNSIMTRYFAEKMVTLLKKVA